MRLSAVAQPCRMGTAQRHKLRGLPTKSTSNVASKAIMAKNPEKRNLVQLEIFHRWRNAAIRHWRRSGDDDLMEEKVESRRA
ncbi:hypothetical protein TB2_029025 [Malus domestica]